MEWDFNTSKTSSRGHASSLSTFLVLLIQIISVQTAAPPTLTAVSFFPKLCWPRPASPRCRKVGGSVRVVKGWLSGVLGVPLGPPTPLQQPPSSAPRVNLLTHAPFAARSGRGLQPFTRWLLMRFQNLGAGRGESDPHWRNGAVERRRHSALNRFWHKTREQCAVVWLWGSAEKSGGNCDVAFDLKTDPGICSCLW